jgi:hypothetical protein
VAREHIEAGLPEGAILAAQSNAAAQEKAPVLNL